MPDGIYAEELAGMLACGCGNPDCNAVAEWLHARCHREAGLDLRFMDGIIEIYCHVCKKPVAAIVVAKKPNSGG